MTSTSLSVGESTNCSSDVAKVWLVGQRVETFHHRIQGGALGADNVHPLAQSRLASSCDPIHRPSRSCRLTFFPRCEKAIAFEFVQGSVDAGAVDWSEPVAKGGINEPIAVAWLFCEQQQYGRIDEMTGRCDGEAATQLTFHTYNLPTISDGET
jgi:hypothetical protein